MMDPRLWSSTPFRNPTAWAELTGMIELFHRQLADVVQYTVLPIGTGRGEGWASGLQQQCQYAASALGTGPAPDLQSYNLDDAGDFASFTFQLGQFHRALQLAAGIP